MSVIRSSIPTEGGSLQANAAAMRQRVETLRETTARIALGARAANGLCIPATTSPI